MNFRLNWNSYLNLKNSKVKETSKDDPNKFIKYGDVFGDNMCPKRFDSLSTLKSSTTTSRRTSFEILESNAPSLYQKQLSPSNYSNFNNFNKLNSICDEEINKTTECVINSKWMRLSRENIIASEQVKPKDARFATTNLVKVNKHRIWDDAKRRVKRQIREKREIEKEVDNMVSSTQELTWDNFEQDVVKINGNIAESEKNVGKLSSLSKSVDSLLIEAVDDARAAMRAADAQSEQFLRARWAKKDELKKEKFPTARFSVGKNGSARTFF